jgi:PHD/YefM family antitoxin component YafN of YafNO toxin-antitoxin module
MINIKPSTALRTRYNEVADFCKTTRSPVFLTKNGEGDLVVMALDTYNEMLNSAHIASVLYKAEQDRSNGIKGIPSKEAFARMEQAIREVENGEV